MKRNEALTYGTMGLNLETLMLKRKSPQERPHHMIPWTCKVQDRQLHGDGKRTGGCRGNGEMLSDGTKAYFEELKCFVI